jgi:hypothetical protein
MFMASAADPARGSRGWSRGGPGESKPPDKLIHYGDTSIRNLRTRRVLTLSLTE